MNSVFFRTGCGIAAALLPLSLAAQPLSVGETQVKFSGYIKFDAIVSKTEHGQLGFPARDFYVPSLTPVAGDSEGAKLDAHARQTRFIFNTTTPTDTGKSVNGHLEFDMMSTVGGDERITNGYTPSIRHAFFTYDKWLFGQTWSTFMDVTSLPESLDFIGNTDGAVFVRQPQVRYTRGPWQFALENPQTTLTPFGGGDRIITDDSRAPDLVVRYSSKGEWGNINLAGLAREFVYDSGTFSDSTMGYGLSLSGKIALPGNDDLRFTINRGDGIGRYLALNTFNDVVLTAEGADAELESISATGASLAYRHWWSDKWRSSVIVAGAQADNGAHSGTAVTKRTTSAALNLVYQANSKMLVGVELRQATREVESGLEGDLSRLQFSAKYDF